MGNVVRQLHGAATTGCRVSPLKRVLQQRGGRQVICMLFISAGFDFEQCCCAVAIKTGKEDMAWSAVAFAGVQALSEEQEGHLLKLS